MAIGRISGLLLQDNLERQAGGVTKNLAIDTDLTYFDVYNRRLGINTTSPQYSLDVLGNVHLGNLVIYNNTIISTTGQIDLGTVANVKISGGTTYDILYTDGSGNLNWGNLQTLTQLDGFEGNNIPLGSNTVGSFSTAVPLSTTTTVTNAIALLNLFSSNLQTNVTTNTSNITTLFSNAAVQATWLANLDANLGTATTNISTLQSNATAQAGQINSINANVLAANSAIAILQSEVYSNANVASYLLSYTGNVTAGNVISTFYGNIHTDYIFPNTQTVVSFAGNTAIQVPSGTSIVGGQPGYLRFNTTLNSLEFYNGTIWVPLTNAIHTQVLNSGSGVDGVTQTFTLDQISSAEGLIVSINGTLQQPGTAYTVVNDQITFIEAPQITDSIDIRFIASLVSINIDTSVVDSANITVNTGLTIIDSFNSSMYRSAKYIISSFNGTDSQFVEVMLTQHNGSTALNTVSNVRTGTNTVTYTANVSGSTVHLLAQGSISSNNLRIEKIYFNI